MTEKQPTSPSFEGLVSIKDNLNARRLRILRKYDYSDQWKTLISPEISLMIAQIYECKGRQNQFLVQQPAQLESLKNIAKIQSVESSNRIEGISISSERLGLLMGDKTTSNTRDEAEMLGYRDVLATIHESFEYIPLETRYILHLHKNLYKASGLTIGGAFKNSNNVIQETEKDGSKVIRFQPVEAWQTPEALSQACHAFQSSLDCAEPLLLIPMFILDFLCIHPFSDGNGRMSRLLTLLLLYRSGVQVGKYVSIEKMIEESKESYYDTLQKSSQGWHENCNNYLPFVQYSLGVILKAYREFEARAELLTVSQSGTEQVRKMLANTIGKVEISDIMSACPNLTKLEIHHILDSLERDGLIISIEETDTFFVVWKPLESDMLGKENLSLT